MEAHLTVMSAKWRYKVKVLVSDGIDSTPLILFDSECYYLLLGNAKIFYLRQRKEDDLFLYDGCYSVRKIFSDSTLINDYKEMVDDDTPLKLKFAPAFTKLEQAEGKSCVIDLSPQYNSVASEVDATPPSSGPCSSSATSMIPRPKHPCGDTDNPPCEKKKQTKLRSVKVERV
ncbi:hypothetical protein SESBI_11202 [Sesbania bispinosa]|nr:hypothetical protein SESBI_11202 [Sesbania bispinosa]